jgi:GAF domain-containing protein
MARTTKKAGRRGAAAGRGGPRTRKSTPAKSRPTNSKPNKPASRNPKPSAASGTANLKRRLQAARRQQQATAEILQAVANAAGDAGRPLQFIAETTARLFEAQSVSIQLAEGREFTQDYRVGSIAKRISSAYPRSNIKVGGRNLPGTVVAEVRQIHIPDLDRLDPSMADFPGLPHARAGGARTVCGTPLRREGKAIGALIVFRDVLAPFTDDELALLQTFADQAVIAIENARLFEEVQAKTRDLSESLQHQTATADVLKVISRSVFDLQVVLDTLVESAYKLCGANLGLLYLQGDEAFECRAIAGLGGVEDASRYFKGRPIRAGRATSAERVIATGEVQSVTDFFSDPDFDPGAREVIRNAGSSGLGLLRSTLAVPMMRDNVVIGVLVIASPRTGPFPSRQVELLQTFADQAVIAIENSRLFNETQAALAQQKALADILSVISNSVSDSKPVFDEILRSVRHLFDVEDRVIFLSHDTLLHIGAIDGPNADVVRELFPVPLRGTVSDIAMRERRLITYDDVLDGEGVPDGLRAVAARFGQNYSIATAPLLAGDRALGALAITRVNMKPFSENECVLLQTLADQAVIAIENARLFNETKEALEQQTATASVLQVISSSISNATPVFDRILESTERLIDCQHPGIFLIADEKLHCAAVRGPDSAAIMATYPMPLVDTPARTIMMQGRQLCYADVANAPGVPDSTRRAAAATAAGSVSIAITPLLWQGEVIGTLTAARDPGITFNDKELGLLRTFADQAVIAIQNARLFNETKEALERQTATSEVLQVISNSISEATPVFERILESTERLITFENAAILVTMPDELLHLAAARGPQVAAMQGLYPMPVAQSSLPIMAAARRQLCFEDAANGPGVPAILRQIALATKSGNFSIALTPLMWEGNAIGMLNVARAAGAKFDEKELSLLRTFADQAVIAIQNARLFNETKEALERQTATSDILNVIAGSPTDTRPVFEAIASRANSLVGGYSSTVFRFTDGMAYLEAFTPTTPEADEILMSTFPRPVADFTPFRMAQSGEVTQIPDIEALTDEIKDIGRARGFRSMLFAPLMNKGISIGFIAVTRVQAGKFDEHHVQLLRTFADQAVIAIGNVQLFDEVQARTGELTESLQQQTATADVLKVISRSAFDLQSVFDTLARSAADLCAVNLCGLHIREGDVLVCRGYAGASKEQQDFVRQMRIPIDDTNYAMIRALKSGEIANIADFDTAPVASRTVQKVLGFKALLMVPLMREGEGIGLFVLGRDRVGAFSPRHIELVQTFADQAVIAIENARLFNEVQARTRELSRSLNDLRTAQDRLVQTEKLASLGQLTAGIAHEIKNPLNFVNNFAALSAELTDELDETLAPAPLEQKMRDDVGELTQMLKANLEKVVAHGKRADSIVKNMLQHSREGSGERRASDLNALVSESLNLAYHGARAERSDFNITLEQDLDPDAGAVEVYPQELTRALLNLISNGFYAAIRRKKEADGKAFEPVLSAATRNAGETVEIRIRDNGTGIPAEIREKIFNPFFTTKPTGEGTGLGLSMTHDIIVKQHGGRIDVETEPGAFTEVTITLPRGNGNGIGLKSE